MRRQNNCKREAGLLDKFETANGYASGPEVCFAKNHLVAHIIRINDAPVKA